MSTPAGWYPDPTSRHQNRWFDGTDWTDQVADGQTVGVDPVHGGGATAATAAGATQVVPATPAQPGPPPGAPGAAPAAGTAPAPPPGAPGAAPAAGPPPGAGTPPPGAPLGTYAGPGASASGGRGKTWLIIGAVVVALAIVAGLVVALGGGDDGDSTASSSDRGDEADQSDAPEDTVDEDPSASDLFDDMADEGDQSDGDVFGTDDEPADEPADTTVDGEYPQEVIDNFNDSCTSAGSPAAFCGCVIDELQATVPYDRFVEIDQELAENPDDIPTELTDAAAACQ